MDKKEFYNKIKGKTSMTLDEYKKIYMECEKEIKERGITENIEQCILALIQSKLKKTLSSPSKIFDGVVIIKGRVYDNARKQREEAKNAWEKNKELAIKNKLVNEQGKPLYTRGYPSLIGTEIPDIEMKCKHILLCREKTENEQKSFLKALNDGDTDIKQSILTLDGEKCHLEVSPLKEVEFRANIGKNSTDSFYELTQSTLTEFKVKSDTEIINLPKLAEKYLKNNTVDLKKLLEYHNSNLGKYDVFVVFQANVSDITFSETKPSNIVRVDELTLDVNDTVTCWVPKELEINFPEGAQGIWFLGRTNLDDQGRLSVNVFSFYTPKEWRVTKPQKVEVPQQIVTEDW